MVGKYIVDTRIQTYGITILAALLFFKIIEKSEVNINYDVSLSFETIPNF